MTQAAEHAVLIIAYNEHLKRGGHLWHRYWLLRPFTVARVGRARWRALVGEPSTRRRWRLTYIYMGAFGSMVRAQKNYHSSRGFCA